MQQTVEILKTTLQPFTDIEEVANLLGIPFDARAASKTTTTSTSLSTFYGTSNSKALDNHSSNLDPRSPEFIDILSKLSKAALFLQTHQDIMDKTHYQVWLERLQHRATSLVGRAMRDLIDKASKTCLEINQAKAFNAQKQSNQAAAGGGAHIVSVEDQPIESAPLYQKFRGLSFRLRELGALLLKGGYFNNSDNGKGKREKQGHRGFKADGKRSGGAVGGGSDVVKPVMQEVKQGYVIVRSELLMPFMREAWAASLLRNGISSLGSASADDSAARASSPRGTPTQLLTGGNSGASLCMGIRQAYSTLLRVTQLEQQLFDALFNVDSINPAEPQLHRSVSLDSSGSAVSEPATPSSVSGVAYTSSFTPADSQEVLSIVETVSNATRDFLRPLIIRESSVDELCRVVSTLSEDVRAQMVAMPVPQLLLKQLLKGLDGTVNDAKERLSYCAETRIRQDVQLFEPMPSQVKYPEILEEYLAAVAERANSSNPSLAGMEGGAEAAALNVYNTWYPPMRSTLSLLSKLYGVVEMAVFEDFARRCLELCVSTLRVGSERIKKSRAALHGDLFLIRHLLILREQLVPFEIRMQGTEKHLDFNNTAAAFTQMVANTQSLWRWDATNGLLQFASTGLPGMNETHVDAKKDLDGVLKQACFSLKLSALKMLLGPLDGFLAKVTAFSGEIPTEVVESGGGYLAGGAGGGAAGGGGAKVALLSAEAVNGLKNQAFVRPERIKEMLEGVQSMLVQTAPELKGVMKVSSELLLC